MKKSAFAKSLCALLLILGLALGPGPLQTVYAAGTPIKVMPLGDSITYGEASSTLSGYRLELWNKLVNQAGFTIDFVGSQSNGSLPDTDHEGHQGWRIDQIAASFDSWAATYQPQVILLHIGTNDMIQNYNVSTAPDRLSALIDQITNDLPNTTVLVAAIIIGNDAAVQARINAYNAAIPGIVQTKISQGKKVKFVDMSSAVAVSDLADAWHPNDAGYAKMATVWYGALEGVLWNNCANEGETCSFSGTMLVRYGSGTTFKLLTLTNGTACTNAVFGDPTPNVVKHCDTSPASFWAFCANENATCTFLGSSPRVVAYGANSSWFYRTATGSIACNNATFGDPIFGTAKQCVNSPQPPNNGWTLCASENGTCSFSGTKAVAYGANGAFFYLPATNSVACNNATFGDPIPNTVKACYYK